MKPIHDPDAASAEKRTKILPTIRDVDKAELKQKVLNWRTTAVTPPPKRTEQEEFGPAIGEVAGAAVTATQNAIMNSDGRESLVEVPFLRIGGPHIWAGCTPYGVHGFGYMFPDEALDQICDAIVSAIKEQIEDIQVYVRRDFQRENGVIVVSPLL